MSQGLHTLKATFLILISFSFFGCLSDEPNVSAERHLQVKMDYIRGKTKTLGDKTFKIVDIKSLSNKSSPNPEEWTAMITFAMIHSDDGGEVMRENFKVSFVFRDPYWSPVKMESEQIWRRNGQNVPWKEITRESNHDGWSMINSLLGLSGP